MGSCEIYCFGIDTHTFIFQLGYQSCTLSVAENIRKEICIGEGEQSVSTCTQHIPEDIEMKTISSD